MNRSYSRYRLPPFPIRIIAAILLPLYFNMACPLLLPQLCAAVAPAAPPLPQLDALPSSLPEYLIQVERDIILRALRDAGGQVGGPHGAAARLGLARTTLHSKMRRLGIVRPSF